MKIYNPKMILTWHFACTREVIILKALNKNSSYSSVWTSVKHILLFGVDPQHSKRNISNLFFQENSDFPCSHYHNGKKPFSRLFLAVNLFLKIIWHFYDFWDAKG